MTRHARNSTAGSVYTYHEKRKDTQSSGYGVCNKRIGKESVKNFDCCSLTLQPCSNPVITKKGVLFDKEAILQYIITKKSEYSKKLKEYEKQQENEEKELTEASNSSKRMKIELFLKTERDVASTKSETIFSGAGTSSSASGTQKPEQVSFWAPCQTPDAKKSKLDKPDSKVYCPITGDILRSKDLITIKFTATTEKDGYMCPITFKTLSNSVQCAVIRTSGDVVAMEAVNKIIKKDKINPLTNEKLTDDDMIPLQRGGTGYATTNSKLEGKYVRPALQA